MSAKVASSSWQLAKSELSACLRLTIPDACTYCHQTLETLDSNGWSTEVRWCNTCRDWLFNGEARTADEVGSKLRQWRSCRKCAAYSWVQTAANDGMCGRCRQRGYRFEAAISLGNYERGLREAILRMKKTADDLLVDAMCEELMTQLEQSDFPSGDILMTSIPPRGLNRWVQGFDLPEMMTQGLWRRMGRPPAKQVLRRRKRTRKQGRLSNQQRLQNLRGAFTVPNRRKPRVKGRNVVLVDDVMTSGATANEATRALRVAGAESVFVIVLARGVRA